ncbi:hypothetical protein M407DRAFT_29540 [Tulasnella calospora MUT 4182]|uniref:F-box domain-containing protein n=1 Tax=Tulasnella calospora MUT 4182 TaxID=1051891 RepID=A0A0C3KH68_9AGAM|nr:hypothetical protein M407DRAFT_29540 [Tulasnella calospora MUT 4182]
MATDALNPQSTDSDPNHESETKYNLKWSCHVLNLPYDILYLVFTLSWSEAGHKQHDFPVLISHVCRVWRQHALDTPGFWTLLKFESTIPEIEKYRTWLERSKDSPFDLEIGWLPFEGASVKHAKAIMRLIFPHVQRLRSLQVRDVPFKIRQLIFDRLNSAQLPSLETLDVKWGWAFDERPSPTDRKFKPFCHGDAANLKHVALERIQSDYVIYRFKKLRTLDIISWNVFSNYSRKNAKTVQDILSLLPDLRTLRIDREYFPDSRSIQSTATIPPSTHTSLEELYLNASQDDIDTIVCALVLPSLRRLGRSPGTDLPVGTCCLPTIGQARPSYLFPNLVGLRLHGRQTSGEPLVDSRNMESFERALAGLPKLESLTLDQVHLEDNKHLAPLTRTCPQLKRLLFVYCSGFVLKELRAMIQSRCDPKGMGSNSLESVHVDGLQERLRRLQKEATEHGLEGDADFKITKSKKNSSRIVVIGRE